MYVCVYVHVYIYIYIHIHIYIYIYIFVADADGAVPALEGDSREDHVALAVAAGKVDLGVLRDKDLYTTTNKCLQCLIKLMYTIL